MNAACLGSFDPITVGHLDLIKRALTMFDKVFVAIGVNEEKHGLFTVDKRLAFIRNAISLPKYGIDASRVVVTSFRGLAADFMLSNDISVTVRGIRDSKDYDYEHPMALINRDIANIESIFIPSDPNHSTISSSNVKALVKSFIDVSSMVPLEVKFNLEAYLLDFVYVGVVGRSGSGKSTFTKKYFPDLTIDYDSIVKSLWDDKATSSMRIKMLGEFGNIHSALVKSTDVVNKDELRKFLGDADNNKLIRNIMKPYIESLARVKLKQMHDSIVSRTQTTRDYNLGIGIRNHKISEDIPDIRDLINLYPYKNFVALDAPMLIEYGNLGLVNNNVIHIDTPYDVCVNRIMKRDKLTQEQVESRLNSQLSGDNIAYQIGYKQAKDGFGTYAKYTSEK
jgi:pantetheine-phosphate adenylyltransferase